MHVKQLVELSLRMNENDGGDHEIQDFRLLILINSIPKTNMHTFPKFQNI